MKTDIEIAQAATMKPIIGLAKEQYDIPSEELDPYGHYKAKLSLKYIESLNDKPDGKLILVTAMSPTPAGEGKTTTTIGLADALNYIGKKSISCTREPSLGPVFGVKGGAAGGGMAQVVPMEDINLHFTGDFHAISAAHNLLAAMVDNHIHQGNALNIDPRLVTYKRVMDMNDRALRQINIGLGGVPNGVPREDGFDIVVASEVMAILCLATSLTDLKERLGKIIIGQTQHKDVKQRKYVYAKDVKADGAMTALLKDALKPNVVQSLENNLCLIHGGPFANIAHGCNTYMATKASLKMCEYTVTEAGFGADLGAEKFIDIKCALTGLRPQAVTIVASVKALKHHGGCDKDGYKSENMDALAKGFANIDRHVNNIREHYKLPVVVSLNHFYHDTDKETNAVLDHFAGLKVPCLSAKHWADGGKGAEGVAKAVIAAAEGATPGPLTTVYPPDISLFEKVQAIASKIYGAKDVTAPDNIKNRLAKWSKEYPGAPVCIAKTQNSFSQDASKRGAPEGHELNIRDAKFCNGAGFCVCICGDVMTMPGLPVVPSANSIDVDADGKIVGLF